jgi:CheY-like chemotaxis protein
MKGKKFRLLVVEDDSIMGMEMKDILEDFGYEVLCIVSSGNEAVKAAESSKPDLVLMDIRLKGEMNGIEASRKIRGFSKAPVIFITGYKNSETAEEAGSIPESFLLTKPVDFEQLKVALEKALAAAS